MSNTLGMLIGTAIDRRDGDSGVAGAIVGYLVEGTLKIVVPLAATAAAGWAARRYARRALARFSGSRSVASA